MLGFSSSIPLELNTENNILIEAEILSDLIPTSYTLGSNLNIVMVIVLVIVAPLLMLVLRPRTAKNKELSDLIITKETIKIQTIKEEASSLKLPFKVFSDKLNNSIILQMLIVIMGLAYIIFHFSTKGFELDFHFIIFIFLIIGLLLHKTPMRYVISMKRSSSNISGILFQYPFYAGIMGIMLSTGMGEKLGQVLASVATIDSYPFYAYITGGIVNFAIPSAGGEFAVLGPSIITAMISRASMSLAYGESLSNMLQPFYLLMVLPVMGAGIRIQARDLMGYLMIPFIVILLFNLLWLFGGRYNVKIRDFKGFALKEKVKQ